MKFSQSLKNINTQNYIISYINPNLIKAQYNPNRFKFWKVLHNGPKQEVLNMRYSPHYRLLKQYIEQNKNIGDIQNTDYYKMQKFYGRDHKWTINKINLFISLYNNILKEGYKNEIIILSKPIIKNKYNFSFEIFEGHHRVSCCLILKFKKILCKIIKEN